MKLKRKKALAFRDFDVPSGSAVQTPTATYYIKGSKKFKILSSRVLDSWRFPRVTNVTDECAGRYKTMGRLGFREGTLIKSITTGETLLISENKARLVTSPDTLKNLNATYNEVIIVSVEEIALHERGENI